MQCILPLMNMKTPTPTERVKSGLSFELGMELAQKLEQAQAVIRDRDEKIHRHVTIQLEKDAELERAQLTQAEQNLIRDLLTLYDESCDKYNECDCLLYPSVDSQCTFCKVSADISDHDLDTFKSLGKRLMLNA